METQAISGAVGVLGAAIAALGLLLTWYRYDRPKESARPHPREVRVWRRRVRRSTLAGVLTAGILLVSTMGVIVAFATSSPQPAKALPASPPTTASPPITEAEYRASMSRICTAANEDARRIEEASPQGSVLGAALGVEQKMVNDIQAVRPPNSLMGMHNELLATWQRRISLLDSIYRRAAAPDDRLDTDLDAADALADKITELAARLGVPECSF